MPVKILDIDITTRSIYRVGGSISFSVPGRWRIPEILNVYSDSVYVVYSSTLGISSLFNVSHYGKVKRRIKRSERATYYLLTIPKPIARRIGAFSGRKLFLLKIDTSEGVMLIGVSDPTFLARFIIRFMSR